MNGMASMSTVKKACDRIQNPTYLQPKSYGLQSRRDGPGPHSDGLSNSGMF